MDYICLSLCSSRVKPQPLSGPQALTENKEAPALRTFRELLLPLDHFTLVALFRAGASRAAWRVNVTAKGSHGIYQALSSIQHLDPNFGLTLLQANL